jgi:hypothetical protein
MGLNLACGLNTASQGRWNSADSTLEWNEGTPRAGNRRCLQLGMSRLRALAATPWQMVELVRRKYPTMWSRDTGGLDWTLGGTGAAPPAHPWLHAQKWRVRGAIDLFHAVILLLAMVGFWRAGRSPALDLPAAILLTFVLAHTIIEVQNRYMFPVKPFIAMAAAAALVKWRVPGGDDLEKAAVSSS